jgi:heme oxygenase
MKSINELAQIFHLNVINGLDYFVLSAENTIDGEKQLKQLRDNADQYKLSNLFIWDPKNSRILITKKDFIKWQKKVLTSAHKEIERIPLNQRTFFKCGDSYFTIPVDEETVESVKLNLKASAKLREFDISLRDNKELGIIEISEKGYKLLHQTLRAKKVPMTKREYQWDESKQCYFTTLLSGETLEQLKNKLRSQLNREIHSSSVRKKVEMNTELNRIELSEEIYAYIKAKDKRGKKEKSFQSILSRQFTYHEALNMWFLKAKPNEDLKNLHNTLKNACIRRKLDRNIFRINNDQIEISNDNYLEFKKQYLKMKALNNKAYGVSLTKDEQNKVYYIEGIDRHVLLRSFQSLSKLLGIQVKFYINHRRVEITADDYEKWIANPIVKDSLDSIPKDLAKKVKNTKKTEHAEKPQKAENTKGGISVKYLEGAFTIPFDTNTEGADRETQALLSKGHVIPFEQMHHVFLPENNKRCSMSKVAINFHGIQGKVTIYKSQPDIIEDIFLNNNIVFVRGGRKENAFLPKLMQDEKTLIMMLMTREEYDEMEKSLGFSPSQRLPSHVKLCVIESCSLRNQPAEQQNSYLRSSNIKRAIAYAMAEGFKLQDFILMDDNTEQIQIANEVVNDDSMESLFNLFYQYKTKGTICATLGSFEFFKPIARPLDASHVEDIEERLGSKIMFVDYKRLSKKLKSEKKQLHEIVSPCSLWWGEDYFNMLAILQLIENEEQKSLLGVVPFSIAWHKRSHTHQNKAKQTPNFQLANIWLTLNEEYLKSLTPHQQQIVRLMQNLVRRAIEQQEAKQSKFFENLTKDQITEVVQEIQAETEDPIVENSHFRMGYHHGEQIANCGHPLDLEKLQNALDKNSSLKGAQRDEYIRGVAQAHETTWNKLTPQTRAICRGYRDGLLAAKDGYKAEKLNIDSIPSIYQDQNDYYLQGYKCGNDKQWKNFVDVNNMVAVQGVARIMGKKRAESGFDINEIKLNEIMTLFGPNASTFEAAYREAFKHARSSMSESDIVIRRATQLAKDINNSRTSQVDGQKLGKEAVRVYGTGTLAELYKNTVVNEFNRLRAIPPRSERIEATNATIIHRKLSNR